MTATAELGGEEGVDNLLVELQRHEAAGEADDVAVVVLAAELGKLHGLDGRGADAGDLVGGHGNAQAGAADDDTAVSVAASHHAAHLVAKVGVVDAVVRGGAKVDDLVAQGADVLDNGCLLDEARVVGGNGNAHVSSFPSCGN